ncbi:MAG: hypothetical protein CMJ85_07015 [Planctomycetes bacterium]|nr:hypothetical protein [Planctomycetota bacterium]
MGQQYGTEQQDEELHQVFMRRLLDDVRALERMLACGMIESGVRRIGAEQEMFLITRACRPAPIVMDVLEALDSSTFTTELGRFNLEANLLPQSFGGDCLRRMEEELDGVMARVRAVTAEFGADAILIGALPTLRQSDLGLDNMVPNPRYFALNRAMSRLRGGDFHLRMKGLDEIDLRHDNVMLEACNTSFQVPFQVGPDEFVRLYNLAQAVTGPVLAVAVNSAVLLGHRLWKESRIGVFQQSVDTRSETHMSRGGRPRVHFGDEWVKESAVEIFKEDISRFRVVLATGVDEDSLDLVERGVAPSLPALRLHNGTVYRWNRPCYGVADGVAHLRIENRVIPSGPTIVDEVANAAFFFGLLSGLAEEFEDVTKHMAFDDAQGNFLAAARHGLKAQFTWIGGETVTAGSLILDRLLPLAREGLETAKIAPADIDRYLGVIEGRVKSGQTGAQWALSSLQALGDEATKDERFRTLTAAALTRQKGGEPVHGWTLASFEENPDWRESFRTVGQFMVTELFTVRPGDLVDLAAAMMDWEHLRHVPVEDDDGHLVGLITHRQLLRWVGKELKEGAQPLLVEGIMEKDPVTVSPETSTLDAIGLMREHKVGCLPVVAGKKLVGLVSERDFLEAAAKVFERELREVQ